MGLGDAKFMLAFGFLLPPAHAMLAVMLAFWIGAVVGVTLVVISKIAKSGIFKYLNLSSLNLRSEIAFGPFLFLGAALSFSLGKKIINWYIQFF